MTSDAADPAERFSLVLGGPFHSALRRLRLVGADLLPTQKAAIGLALVAWLLPALLVAAQSLSDSGYAGWGFFTDLTVHTRYLVAIWAMIATERYANGRIIVLTREFREARIVRDQDLPALSAALGLADRRSSSWIAEGIVLALAIAWPGVTAHYAVALAGSSWEGIAVGSEVVLSWGGAAARYLSAPLFLFLALRWIWRFLVWTALLYRISRLPLQLTPLHPDRAAGLGFLAAFPGIFSGFAFALSCVVAAAMVKELGLARHEPEVVWFAIGAWIAFNLVLFIGPLFVFTGPLLAARERALLEYGRLANQHNLALHRKWIEGGKSGEELAGTSDLGMAANLGSAIQSIRAMQFVPVDRATVVQLVVAAGIPMLAVAAKLMPLAELAKWLLRKIL
jgi:hypothetical protein